ncbi:MAG TPA: glycosyltransferase [Gemmatimonadaceae bacterium]|nr:glycosyltransferase [Gemmatimonadaceae bacterium]
MNRDALRVCHVITGLETGGAEMMLAKLCERLDRQRVESSVISLRSGGALASRIREAGVQVTELGFSPGSLRGLLGVGALRRALASVHPHVVQSWMYHANVAASVVSGRTPLLWNIRQTLYDLNREKPLTRATIRSSAILSSRPHVIVYNSALSARQHAALGIRPDKTRVIANGFDVERFRPDPAARASVREELGLDRDALLVGLVARLHPMKNHALFLRAAAAVAARVPNAHFVLVGDGAMTPQLESLSGTPLPDRVHALGRRADLERLTSALDIACSTSSWGEGFSNALGEALACGVPVVSTDVGDAREIVGPCGAIVPPDDVAAFAAALVALLRDTESRRRLGDAARTRLVDRYSIAAIAEEYTTLYESTARTRGAHRHAA